MKSTSIRAHFDGKHILLDETVQLKTDAKLMVTVLPEVDEEREAWLRLANSGLADAYGENEPEYSLDLIKEPNPEYAGG